MREGTLMPPSASAEEEWACSSMLAGILMVLNRSQHRNSFAASA